MTSTHCPHQHFERSSCWQTQEIVSATYINVLKMCCRPRLLSVCGFNKCFFGSRNTNLKRAGPVVLTLRAEVSKTCVTKFPRLTLASCLIDSLLLGRLCTYESTFKKIYKLMRFSFPFKNILTGGC